MDVYYSPSEKAHQLSDLVVKINDLIFVMETTAPYRKHLPALVAARCAAEKLMGNPLSQTALNALADSLPKLIPPKFDPPLEQNEKGEWHLAGWYQRFIEKYEPFSVAAQTIREIGYVK